MERENGHDDEYTWPKPAGKRTVPESSALSKQPQNLWYQRTLLANSQYLSNRALMQKRHELARDAQQDRATFGRSRAHGWEGLRGDRESYEGGSKK
ncbi:hypothetical protein IF1G_01588 [Cordyceps javanica]|uniref:Uncharacterized protein n=1 Tax=Cordyceps javanica TaxID=43265 RepID=A0A545VCE0_9HYPO|nr:hypothetical protein IF1G_01588 [Cordyceps javanica]